MIVEYMIVLWKWQTMRFVPETMLYRCHKQLYSVASRFTLKHTHKIIIFTVMHYSYNDMKKKLWVHWWIQRSKLFAINCMRKLTQLTNEKTRSTRCHWSINCNPFVENKNNQIAKDAEKKDHLWKELAENTNGIVEISAKYFKSPIVFIRCIALCTSNNTNTEKLN
jgi:hypothetical protein